jgi:hypothetical protein
MMLPSGRQGLFPVTCFHEFVALRPQAGAKKVAIGLVVIDDENARRVVHRRVRRG